MRWLGGIRGRVALTVLVVATALYSILGTLGFLQIAHASRDATRDRIGAVLDQLETSLRAGSPTVTLSTADGIVAFATAATEDEPVGGRGEIVVSRSVTIDGSDLLLVGRASEAKVTDSLRSLHRVLWTGVSLAALATAALAGLATHRALRPVRAMTDLAGTIGPGDDQTRVPVADTADEIARLGTTINAMLGRIAEGRQAQQRFTSDAAHELRTPLMALQGEIELAERSPSSIDDGFLARIGELAQSLGGRVDDLLLLSTLDEAPPLRLRRVDLTELVGEEAAVVSPTVVVSGEPVIAEVDPRLLARAVRNVVSNAVRHAVARVDVTVAADDRRVTVTVDDDGPGIAPEDRDRIFERFTRLDEGRGADRGGSGLGLAIVASVVHAHGGTVTATAGPSGGTRVVLRFDAAGSADVRPVLPTVRRLT